VLLNGISDAQLQWCYRNCSLLLAPSTTEGFGLPVAEALLAGCRVVCSDIPPFREFGKQHCRFVALSGDEENDLASAISSSLCEPARSPVPLPQFSLQVLAGQYVALYRNLIASPSFAPSALL